MTEASKLRIVIVFCILLFSLIALSIWAAGSGSVSIAPIDVINSILGKGPIVGTSAYNIIMKIRLPRLVCSIVMGGALSLSGFLLQTYFRNPMAGPFVLGISSSSKMAVTIAMMIAARALRPLNTFTLVLSSLAGAWLAIGAVLLIAPRLPGMASLLVGA